MGDAKTGRIGWVQEALALFAWALLCPSRWRAHLARIDPALRPDFALIDLSPSHLRDPTLRRVLLQIAAVGPVLATGATLALLSLVEIPPQHRWVAAMYGLTLGLTGTVITASALSVIGAVWGGVFITAAFGFACGSALEAAGTTDALAAGLATLDATVRVAGGLPAAIAPEPHVGVAISISIGVAGYMAAAVRHDPHPSIGRQTGAGVLGIVTCLVTHGGALLLLLLVSDLSEGLSVVSFAFAALAAMAVIIVGSLLRRGRRVTVITAGAVAGTLAAAVVVSASSGSPVLQIALSGAPTAIFYSLLFVLAFVLADHLGGRWAASVAGAVGSGTAFVLFAVLHGGTLLTWSIVPLSAIGNVVGLLLPVWLPLLMYPFEMAANLLLLRADAARTDHPARRLYSNSVFWNERQWLPLKGLDEHLLIAFQRNVSEGAAALERVATGRQRWAARAARVELDARTLEDCPDVDAISQMAGRIAPGELPGSAGEILRKFLRATDKLAVALVQGSLSDQHVHLLGVERSLQDLIQDLTRGLEPASRFLSIAIRWRDVVRAHLGTVRQLLEDRQEIRNPYVRGLPLTEEQDIFVGRSAVCGHIAHVLQRQARSAVLLYGQRRMGKTSLLNRLGRLLPTSIVPLFVDLQSVARASGADGLLFGISRSVAESARRHRGLAITPLARQALALDPFTAFDLWLDELERDLGDAIGLLAFDEFEALDAALRMQRFDERDVLGTFRQIIQHRRRITVLLAGSHTLDEVSHWATYLINVQTIHLSYLNLDEALQLVERPFSEFPLVYQPDASRRVIQLTRCHPLLIQLLCYHGLELKNTHPLDRRRIVTVADVEAAVPDALASGAMFFFDIGARIGTVGERLLERLADAGEGVPESAATLSAAVDTDGVEDVLALLERRELIEAAPGGYRFQVELVRRWFAERRHRRTSGLRTAPVPARRNPAAPHSVET